MSALHKNTRILSVEELDAAMNRGRMMRSLAFKHGVLAIDRALSAGFARLGKALAAQRPSSAAPTH